MFTSLAAGAAESLPRAGVDTETEKARELHAQGDRLYQRGEYGRAHAAYVAAWSLKKDYEIAGNLGDCEVRLGKYRDAAEHLAYFIRGYPKGKPVDTLLAGIRLFRKAESKVGTISIVVDAPGADILVEGSLLGQSPLNEPIYLDPGSRLIEAHRGQEVAWARIDVTPGMAQTVALKLGANGQAEASREHHREMVITGASISAGAIGLGSGLAVAAIAAASNAGGAQSNHVFFSIGAALSLGAGVAIAAVTAHYASSPKTSEMRYFAMTPWIGPNRAGVLMTGQF